MSFNHTKRGRKICTIRGGNDEGTDIYVDGDLNVGNKKKVSSFSNLKIDDGEFSVTPSGKKDENRITERSVIMVVGASGSGKSTWISKYCEEYHELHPKRPIYLFSYKDEDPAMDKLKYVKRVKIDSDLVTDPLGYQDFEKSLVCFDDVSSIKDKDQRKAVYALVDEIIEIGRSYEVSCILVTHYPNTIEVRNFLNECNIYVYFPWSAIKSTHNVLMNYIGIDKNIINLVKSLKSRWCAVFKNYPQAIVTEKAIFLAADQI